jgi:hypothetical protein
MSQLFAIRGPRNRINDAGPPAPAAEMASVKSARASSDQDDSALARLLKMIPGEAVSFYGTSVASLDQLYKRKLIPDAWSYFWLLVLVALMALVLLVVIRWKMSKDPKTGDTQWEAVLITVVSFLIYAYTIGGPFQHYPGKIGPGWLAPVGFMAASFWTSITPYLFEAK